MPRKESYYLDGKTVDGDAFRAALAELDLNQPDCITIRRADNFAINVGTSFTGGSVNFLLTRPDGSTWNSYETMDLRAAQDRIDLFLQSDQRWDEGLNWEKSGLSKKEARFRILVVISIGLGLVILIRLILYVWH